MAQVESRKNEIQAAGAQLLYIAAEKRDGVWKPGRYLEKHPISYSFLLDEDRAITKAYGLRHLIAHDALNIAHPASIVVEPGGAIRYIYQGENQLDRAPLDEILKAVREIRS